MSDDRQPTETDMDREHAPSTTAESVNSETNKILTDVLKAMNVELDEEALKLIMAEGGKEFDKIFAQIAAQQTLQQKLKK